MGYSVDTIHNPDTESATLHLKESDGTAHSYEIFDSHPDTIHGIEDGYRFDMSLSDLKEEIANLQQQLNIRLEVLKFQQINKEELVNEGMAEPEKGDNLAETAAELGIELTDLRDDGTAPEESEGKADPLDQIIKELKVKMNLDKTTAPAETHPDEPVKSEYEEDSWGF